MSTVYRGKLHFTEQELTTKYDKISLNTYNRFLYPMLPYCNAVSFETSDCLRLCAQPPPPTPGICGFAMKRACIKQMVGGSCGYPGNSFYEWIRSIIMFEDDENFEYTEFDNSFEVKLQENTCKYCNMTCLKPECLEINSDEYKKEFVNLVFQSMLYGLQEYSSYLSICNNLVKTDPEFIIKVSLFCRRELNVRTISNFIVGIAAYLPETRNFLLKYFNTIVNLPTDWIEIAYYYMLLAQSKNYPHQLRKALVSKFSEFSTYQIGKYQHKSTKVEIQAKNIKLSLKSLIRTLHISEPVQHVMPLLGKRYPMDSEEFSLSKLPDQFEESKKGLRMKIPVPETWETQLAQFGNKAKVWQKLIDNKKLPYMAMIRNLRNILQSNIKDSYHTKISQSISKESNVIKGKLLPFQYFTAFKILEEYNESILKAQTKLADLCIYRKTKKIANRKKGQPNHRDRIRKVMRLQKIMNRTLASEDIINMYTKALNKAIRISTIYNVPPIKGKVCILANIVENTIFSGFKYGSSKSTKEVIALLTSLFCFISENVEVYLVNGGNLVIKYSRDSKHKTILEMSKDILAVEEKGKASVDYLLDEMITKQHQFQLILTFDVNVHKDLLNKYIKYVNPSVKIFINSMNKKSNDRTFNDTENIFHLYDFSEHSVRIISEQNNGDIIKTINLIDNKFDLVDMDSYSNNNINNNRDYISEMELERALDENLSQKEINIFISSTFKDMEKERNIINRIIIPAVKKFLAAKNINFIDINCIDLRWGVPPYWGENDKLLEYCIKQVKRCDIFVGILGLRYGWVPDSRNIENLLDIIPEIEGYETLSITHMEYKFAPPDCSKVFFIKPCDNNEEYEGDEIFYFRKEVMANECYYNYSPDNLPQDFNIMISHLTRIISERFLFECPLTKSICMDHKDKIRNKLIVNETKRLLNYYAEDNTSSQKHEIDEIIGKLQHMFSFNRQSYSTLVFSGNESNKHRQGKRRREIKTLQSTDNGGILLLEGNPGSGKTSLLSGLISKCDSLLLEQKELEKNSFKRLQFAWIFQAVKSLNIDRSITLNLFNLIYDLIEYLVQNLNYSLINRLQKELGFYESNVKEDFWKPVDLENALLIWNTILKLMNEIKDTQITIFIDGIEQLSNGMEASAINWIPLVLPSNFIIILTALTNSKLALCGKLRKDVIIHEILPIPLKYKREVIENMLKKQGKALDSVYFTNHVSEFTRKRDSDKPLYLNMAIHNLLSYASFETINEKLNELPSTLDSLIMYSLTCIENELPREFVLIFFSFVINSKIGFKMEDIQMLMSIYFRVVYQTWDVVLTKDNYASLLTASKLPLCFPFYALILIKNLSGDLILHEDHNGRIQINKDHTRQIVAKYVESIDKKVINYTISLYYERIFSVNQDKIACRDIVYYKYSCHLFDECERLLTDINFLRKRFEFGVAKDLLNDYEGYGDLDCDTTKLWIEISEKQIFKDFKTFIRKNLQFLMTYPKLFDQQALNEPVGSYVNLACAPKTTLVPFEYKEDRSVIFHASRVETDNMDIKESDCYVMSNKISCVAPGLQLNIVAIGYENGLIQICNLKMFQVLLNLRKHILKVNKICFYESDTKLISVGEDVKAYIWDSIDGTVLYELKGHYRSITDCVNSDKCGVTVTGGLDAQLVVWKSGVLEHSFKTKSPINCIAKHPVNDFKVIVGCWNGDMIIYNLLDYKKVGVLHDIASVKAITFHPQYELFLSSNIAGETFTWNSKCGVKLQKVCSENSQFPSSLSFSADGMNAIEFASNDSQKMGANIWSTAVGYQTALKKLTDVSCMDANDSYIAYGTETGKLLIMRSNMTRNFEKDLCGVQLTLMCFQNSSEKFFTLGVVDYNNIIYIIQIVNNDVLVKHEFSYPFSKPVSSICFHTDNLVLGSEDCSLGIVKMNSKNWEFLSPITNVFLGTVSCIDVYDDFILACSQDMSIGLFNIRNQILLNHELNAHSDWINVIKFAGSDNCFLSGSNDFTVKIWKIESQTSNLKSSSDKGICFPDPATFSVLHILVNHTSSIISISFKNNDLFATASKDGTIKLWNMKGIFLDNIILKNNYLEISDSECPISWIKFLNKRKTLLALNENLELHELDLKRKCLINKITDHCEPVISSFYISKYLFTASIDGSIRKWNINNIFQNKYQHINQYKVINSLYFGSLASSNDAIVAITVDGLLLVIACEVHDKWRVVNIHDLKPHYTSATKSNLFTTNYLFCQSLKKVNENEIMIEFSQMTFHFDLCSKSITKTISKNSKKSEEIIPQSIDVQRAITEESFINILQNDSHKFVLRFTGKGQFLELISIKIDQNQQTTLSRIPLNGYPCHGMMFVNSKKEHTIFIAYLQGIIDVIELKQICLSQ